MHKFLILQLMYNYDSLYNRPAVNDCFTTNQIILIKMIIAFLLLYNAFQCSSAHRHDISIMCSIFSSPVGSLCHTLGVVHRRSSIVCRVSSVSTITTRNN